MDDTWPPAKHAIRAAAYRLFADRGYAGTSVRDIGAQAGVDPALVIRYFGSKQELFLATMSFDLADRELLDGPVETLGERWMRSLFELDGDVRGVYLALVRASDAGDVHSALHEANERFVRALAALLPGDDAETRARAGAAVIGGLLSSFWIVGDAELAALPREELVRRFGAVLQSAIDGRRPATTADTPQSR